MRRLSRAAVAAAVVAAGALSALPMSPVRSQATNCDAAAGDSTKIEGSLTKPTTDQVEETSLTIRVEGSGFRYVDRPAVFNSDLSDIRRIEAQVLACDAQVLPSDTNHAETYGGDDPASGRPFGWDTPELHWNGRYAIRLTITAANNTTRAIVQPFRMDLPATAPTGVKAAGDVNGVTVTWDANPEPDIVGYLVEWTTAADDDFSERQTAEVLPADEDADPPTRFSHKPGVGEWRYRVVALRPGTRQQGFNPSAPSPATTASVTAPTTTVAAGGSTGTGGSTTGTGGGTSAASSGGTTTTARGGTAARGGTVDLSNFSRLLDQRRAATPTPRRPVEADPGFDETLPFQPGDDPEVAAAAEPASDDAQQEFAQEIISDDSERRQAMTFIAASLLFAVLGYGLRLVKREADRVDLEPTEPEAADPVDTSDAIDTAAGEAAAAEPTAAPTPLVAEPAAAASVEAIEPAQDADDRELVGVGAAVGVVAPARMPRPRPVADANAPHLDVPLPPRRPRRGAPDRVGTADAGRTARRVSSGPRADRGAGGEAVRTRRRGTGGSDRRTSVG